MNPAPTTVNPKIKPRSGIGFFNDEYENALDARPSTQAAEKSKEGKLNGESGTLFTFTETTQIAQTLGSIDFQHHQTTDTFQEQKSTSQPLKENLSAALGITANAATEVSVKTLKLTTNITKDTLSAVFDLFEMFTGKALFKKEGSKPRSSETPQEQAKQKDIEEKKFVQEKLQETETTKNQVSAMSAQELLKQALMIDVGPMSGADAKNLGLSSSLSGEHLINKYHLMNKARKMDESVDNQKKAQMNAGIKSGGPDLSLNKVGEGGSIMSSTGGAGAG